MGTRSVTHVQEQLDVKEELTPSRLCGGKREELNHPMSF